MGGARKERGRSEGGAREERARSEGGAREERGRSKGGAMEERRRSKRRISEGIVEIKVWVFGWGVKFGGGLRIPPGTCVEGGFV